ncbi:uncharacterized protein IWZ02DRAFT_83721 [Phyllosticta citriasiana]|uniref:uncharacterized protein n=1 Tax=Phyllosticta citriasiana TaxID=595635 RepID=UPI0030FD6CB9
MGSSGIQLSSNRTWSISNRVRVLMWPRTKSMSGSNSIGKNLRRRRFNRGSFLSPSVSMHSARKIMGGGGARGRLLPAMVSSSSVGIALTKSASAQRQPAAQIFYWVKDEAEMLDGSAYTRLSGHLSVALNSVAKSINYELGKPCPGTVAPRSVAQSAAAGSQGKSILPLQVRNNQVDELVGELEKMCHTGPDIKDTSTSENDRRMRVQPVRGELLICRPKREGWRCWLENPAGAKAHVVALCGLG